jgi:hypothetical protein
MPLAFVRLAGEISRCKVTFYRPSKLCPGDNFLTQVATLVEINGLGLAESEHLG